MDSRLQRQFEQMEAVRESVFDMLKFYSPDQLAFKPAPDKWSVIQVLQHLLISEQGTYQYLTRKNQAESLPDAGWGAGVRSRLLKVGLLSPLRFKVPKQLTQPPGGQPFEVLMRDWREVREALREFAAALPRERLKSAIFRHPFVGYLTLSQTFDFIDKHVRHHRRQIRRILNAPGFTAS